MPDKLCLKGSRNPLEMARSLAYKMRFRKEHPDFIDPCGLMVFCGSQGCKARTMGAAKALFHWPFVRSRTGESPSPAGDFPENTCQIPAF